MRCQARCDREAAEILQDFGRTGAVGQLAFTQQLFIDQPLLGDAQAIGYLDDEDAVEEGLVVLVVLELQPFGLIRMGKHDALIGKRAEILRSVVAALLRGGQQRVQNLDRRLEHLDEFEKALRRAVEAAAIGIGIGIGLTEVFELSDIDLADQRRNVLIVLVARLGLGDGDLAQPRRHDFDDAELRDVAADFVEPLGCPGRDETGQTPPGDAVFFLQKIAHAFATEEAERRFEDRADLAIDGEHVDRLFLHQLLQPFGKRRLAAAHRPKEVEDLLALFEALRGVAEITHDALDRILHAEEIGKGRIELDRAVGEDAPKALVRAGVDQLRLPDRRYHALRRRRIHARIVAAPEEIFLQAQRLARFTRVGF